MSRRDGSPAGTLTGSGRTGEILAAATELFNDKGFHSTTIDDVGAAVGLTGPALYRYFRGKSELLVAIFDSTMDYLLGSADPLQLADAAGEDALDTLIHLHIDYVLAHRSLMRIVRREVHSLPPEARERFRANQRRYLEAWAGTLRRVRADLDRDHAMAMVAGAVALANRYARRDNEIEGSELKAMMMAMVQAALLAPLPALALDRPETES
ncbi:MAG: TetR family transcriptional regulator [Micromonosporaceae bacterium]|nr:TetR family transcriptional regulator [Micromonosporaceae bacterium]